VFVSVQVTVLTPMPDGASGTEVELVVVLVPFLPELFELPLKRLTIPTMTATSKATASTTTRRRRQ
jgi:hypothetical protein